MSESVIQGKEVEFIGMVNIRLVTPSSWMGRAKTSSMGFLDYKEKEFDLEEMKDEEILALSIKHPHTFEVLIDRYEAAFMRKARSILFNEAEAEDIVQEAFTKIYINARRYEVRPGATFKSWAYRILINTAFTRYQKLKREKGARSVMDPEVFEALGDFKTRDFEKLEVSEYVFSILSKIPEHLARALKLHILEGRSQEEVAKIEGISVGAVKTRVHRAKKAFKDIDIALI